MNWKGLRAAGLNDLRVCAINSINVIYRYKYVIDFVKVGTELCDL
jgi:hypothetical protein